jgi:hypothetical protein
VCWLAAALAIATAVVVVAIAPTTTRQGVNFAVETHELPVYVKALDFIDRDVNYGALARRIAGGEKGEAARALAALAWTRANIRDTPAGFRVVDDHVWHIIVRGYGEDDQKVDVFTTLASYAGVPSYWVYLTVESERLPIAFARIDGRWRVLDVANGVIFRNGGGELATAEEVAGDSGLVVGAAGRRTYRGQPYVAYFQNLRPPRPPDILRAEQQMLWRRLVFETRRLVGLGGRAWTPEPLPGQRQR